MSNQLPRSSVPEIPPEIQNRAPIALTHAAAEDGKAKPREGLTDSGKSGKINAGLAAYNAKKKAAVKKGAAKAGPSRQERLAAAIAKEPAKGMTAAQIEEIMGKRYDGQPEMDPNLGDRDQRFINWLVDHHIEDAAIRFGYRNITATG